MNGKVEIHGNFTDFRQVGALRGDDDRNFYITILRKYNVLSESMSQLLGITGVLSDRGFHLGVGETYLAKSIFGLFMIYQNSVFQAFVLAAELHIAESWAVLRIGIECLAVVNKIVKSGDPEQTARLWVERDSEDLYRASFFIKESDFKGSIASFLDLYKEACGRGSHPTYQSIKDKWVWEASGGTSRMTMYMFDIGVAQDEHEHEGVIKNIVDFTKKAAIYFVDIFGENKFCVDSKIPQQVISEINAVIV